MPKPVPVPVRRKLLQLARRGQGAAALAAAFDLPVRTVRHLLKRFRDRGAAAVDPDYRAPRALPHAHPAEVRDAALALRREHPGWGAELIRVALRVGRPELPSPSATTLRRWSRDAGLGPAPRGHRPSGPRARAAAPHEAWQVDASERIPLRDGTEVCWLRVVDEASGAVLRTAVFPPGAVEPGASPGHPGRAPGDVRAVGPARAIAGGQRHAVGLAGRPADGPGLLAGRPGGGRGRQPAPPPRGQRRGRALSGVGKAWAEPGRCGSAAELGARLEELDRWQRELYPMRGGRPRGEAFPGLRHSGRAYSPEGEATAWDVRRAWELLESYVVPRRVDSQGRVSLYQRRYRVGALWAGREIWVGFDAQSRSWVFQDESGHEITRRVAAELDAERIQALEVTNRRRGIHAAKPHDR